MSEGTIHLEMEDGIGVLSLDRPPVNAINFHMAELLLERLEEVDDQPLDALVLTGAAGSFSAGLDLKEILEYDDEKKGKMVEFVNRTAIRLHGFSKPVVCAVTGHAIAGGMLLVLASDYRVGPDEGAQFGLTEARVGIPVPTAALEMLKSTLSPHVVRRLLFVAEPVGPNKAMDMGVLDELTARDNVFHRATEVARNLGSYPGFTRTKRDFKRATLERMKTAAKTEALGEDWVRPGAREAIRQLLKRRKSN